MFENVILILFFSKEMLAKGEGATPGVSISSFNSSVCKICGFKIAYFVAEDNALIWLGIC